MNVVLATSGFGNAQISIDYHAQSHEEQQGDHVSCGDEMHKALGYRIDSEHQCDLIDYSIAQISASTAKKPQLVVLAYPVEKFSKKPITLTHNITLLI